MKNKNTMNMMSEVSKRLKNANISFYKIALKIDEPKSTIQNLFSGQSNYAEERVKSILDKINLYLDELEESKNGVKKLDWDMITCATEDPELFIKLYALGLDSKAFTPDEKYKLAVAYKKLTDSQTK
jgi:cyanate lyase